MVHNERLFLKSFLQTDLKTWNNSVPQTPIVASILAIAISELHFQNEKKFPLEENYTRELSATLTLSFPNFFVLQGFFLPTLYLLDTFFFNKLTNEEDVFLLYIIQQQSGKPLIGSLANNRICTNVQKTLIPLNKK